MSYTLHTRKTWDQTMRDLRDSFYRWGIDEWTAYSDKDSDRVTLRYRHPGGKEVVLTYSDQMHKKDNLRALYLCIEDMRMLEARGLAQTMQDAYLQLAAPEMARDPCEVLSVRPESPMEVIEMAYKALAKSRHPDAGGSDAAMKELNEAMERIKQERAA